MDNEKNKRRYCSEGGCPRGKLFASNWLEGISESGDFDVVEVSFKNTRVGFYTNPSALPLRIGDIVAVEGNPGHDIGRVSMVGRLVRMQMRKNGVKADSELKRVFRLATQADMEKFEEARSREHATMIRTRKIAEELELNMKIGDVEYQGDGGKAIFYYIADERVDFRKLIRILADTFKIRVEMKQIGARQEAGRIGGIGPCGRPLCCASWMTNFVSVGTAAARFQDISLNPQKLAGQCAKLKCCLNFEVDAYVENLKRMPSKDVRLETADNTYYHFKYDVFNRMITYSTDKSIPANLVTISADRAFEIMAMNKQGEKPLTLQPDGQAESDSKKPYADLLDQDNINRFDNKKRKKRKPKPKGPKEPDGADEQTQQRSEKPKGNRQGGERRNRPHGDRRKPKGDRPDNTPSNNNQSQNG